MPFLKIFLIISLVLIDSIRVRSEVNNIVDAINKIENKPKELENKLEKPPGMAFQPVLHDQLENLFKRQLGGIHTSGQAMEELHSQQNDRDKTARTDAYKTNKETGETENLVHQVNQTKNDNKSATNASNERPDGRKTQEGTFYIKTDKSMDTTPIRFEHFKADPRKARIDANLFPSTQKQTENLTNLKENRNVQNHSIHAPWRSVFKSTDAKEKLEEKSEEARTVNKTPGQITQGDFGPNPTHTKKTDFGPNTTINNKKTDFGPNTTINNKKTDFGHMPSRHSNKTDFGHNPPLNNQAYKTNKTSAESQPVVEGRRQSRKLPLGHNEGPLAYLNKQKYGVGLVLDCFSNYTLDLTFCKIETWTLQCSLIVLEDMITLILSNAPDNRYVLNMSLDSNSFDTVRDEDNLTPVCIPHPDFKSVCLYFDDSTTIWQPNIVCLHPYFAMDDNTDNLIRLGSLDLYLNCGQESNGVGNHGPKKHGKVHLLKPQHLSTDTTHSQSSQVSQYHTEPILHYWNPTENKDEFVGDYHGHHHDNHEHHVPISNGHFDDGTHHHYSSSNHGDNVHYNPSNHDTHDFSSHHDNSHHNTPSYHENMHDTPHHHDLHYSPGYHGNDAHYGPSYHGNTHVISHHHDEAQHSPSYHGNEGPHSPSNHGNEAHHTPIYYGNTHDSYHNENTHHQSPSSHSNEAHHTPIYHGNTHDSHHHDNILHHSPSYHGNEAHHTPSFHGNTHDSHHHDNTHHSSSYHGNDFGNGYHSSRSINDKKESKKENSKPQPDNNRNYKPGNHGDRPYYNVTKSSPNRSVDFTKYTKSQESGWVPIMGPKVK